MKKKGPKKLYQLKFSVFLIYKLNKTAMANVKFCQNSIQNTKFNTTNFCILNLIKNFIKQKMRAKSAMNRKPINIDYQIQHQSQKSKILDEDRKNFLRQAQEIKQKNKQEIEKLKQQNKKLKNIRDQFISSKKSRNQLSRTAYNSMGSSPAMNSTATEGGFGAINDQNYLRRILDKEKHNTKTKKNALFTLQDKLKQVQSNKLRYIQESPLMRNIRILENRLDKVMIKYNEAQSIQQTYQTVVKRLKQQRVGYDSQLAAIQSSLKGKQHDFEQLLLLAHDATHAKEGAYSQLKRFEQRRVTVQEMRHKYLNDKKQQIHKDIPQQTQQNNQMQEKDKQKIMYNPKATAAFSNSYKHDENYQRQQLNDYEDAFRRLKQVTGVIDANQIIQKFKTQGLTTNSLQQLKQSYKRKIENLKQQKEKLKKDLEDQKFINPSSTNERKRLDQIQSATASLTNQHQRINLKSERLSSQLINVKAGIAHLKQQTAFYKKQGQASVSLEDDLKNINEKLRRMYDVVKNDPGYAKHYYKGNASAIRNIITENTNERGGQYRNYNESQGDSSIEDQ